MNNYDFETPEYLKYNLKLFQCWLLSNTEEEHVKIFCGLIQPYGTVIDMGSGVGNMGKMMQEYCSGIEKVINITNSDVQIAHMNNNNLNCIYTDYEYVPLEDETADLIMFNESFGYGNPENLIKESARLLKQNGSLVIKDGSTIVNLNKSSYSDGWGYYIHPTSMVTRLAEENGLKLLALFHPKIFSERWINFMKQSSMKYWHGEEPSLAKACVYRFAKI